MEFKDYVTISVHVHHKTLRAVFVSDTGDEQDAVWIPLSVLLNEPQDIVLLEDCEITLPEYIAVERGLI